MSTEIIQPHELAIPVIDEEKSANLFDGDGLKLEMDGIESNLSSVVLDPSNPEDYRFMKSVNHKLGKYQAAVDRVGKAIVVPLKKEAKLTDDKRNTAKARMTSIRSGFMLSLVQFDDEVAAHTKAINDLAELFQHGHIKLAEFRKPTEAEWTAHIVLCESAVISEELQGDRLEEFQKLKAEAVEMNKRRFAEFVETEKAVAAGRVALQLVQDKEAAERVKVREAEAAAKESQAVPEVAKAEPEAKEAPKPAVTPESTAKNAVYGQLLKRGMDKDKAILFVNDIAGGKIEYLKLEV